MSMEGHAKPPLPYPRSAGYPPGGIWRQGIIPEHENTYGQGDNRALERFYLRVYGVMPSGSLCSPIMHIALILRALSA